VSDSSDDRNRPNEESGYAPGYSEGQARLEGIGAFVLREASRGNPQALDVVHGRAGGQVSASGYGQVLPAMCRMTPALYQRHY
jgi:hypothetical protein